MLFDWGDYEFCLGIRILEYDEFCNILGLEKSELYLNIQDIVRCRNLKEKVLWAINFRNHQLAKKEKNSLPLKIESRFARAAMNMIWTARLLKTSLTVTRTPTTTLRSIVKAHLNFNNGKKGKSEDQAATDKNEAKPISFHDIFTFNYLKLTK